MSVRLQNSSVSRSGVTAKSYNYETNEIDALSGAGRVRLHFQIASAGGGTTDVSVVIKDGGINQLDDLVRDARYKARLAQYKRIDKLEAKIAELEEKLAK